MRSSGLRRENGGVPLGQKAMASQTGIQQWGLARALLGQLGRGADRSRGFARLWIGFHQADR